MDKQNNIILPEPTIRRLPWYLSYLEILRSQGTQTVSSTKIARAINVDASQIAKDLSVLNIKGKTRIGYDVNTLVEALTDFLGFRIQHNAVIVGTGSLGAALIHDRGLDNYGLKIVAGFDIDPQLIGVEICGVPVFDPQKMKEVRASFNASIGILCVPANTAQESADRMVAAGFTAIWNFTPYRIRVREGIVMTNTSIYAHLALIYNRLGAIEDCL